MNYARTAFAGRFAPEGFMPCGRFFDIIRPMGGGAGFWARISGPGQGAGR